MKACPRCRGWLARDEDGDRCVNCGHGTPSSVPPRGPNAPRLVARYSGDTPALQKRRLCLQLGPQPGKGRRVRPVYRAACPFCGDEMAETSGGTWPNGTVRFACPRNHRVSLQTRPDGTLVWQ